MKPAIKSALAQFLKLTPAERDEFLSTIATQPEPADERYLHETKTKDGVVCPFCGSHSCVIRNGKRNGRQRYKCKTTGKFFTTTTGDVLYYSKKPLAVWKKYIDCLINCFSLKKCAEICEISLKTAFAWRHKILDALRIMQDEVKLSGVVEADETYLAISYAGNHKKSKVGFVMPRKARKRGGEVHLRGLSHERVCIPCAVTRDKLSVAKVGCLGNASNKAIVGVLGGNIETGSILCTDKSRAYKKLVESNGLEQVKIEGGRSRRGVFSIQTVNNYHSNLKTFMRKFYGVSTKHLNNYLVYHNFLRGVVGSQRDKVKTLFDFIIGVDCFTTWAEVTNRPNLPLAA